MRTFASDNASGAHPAVLAAVQEANDGHALAYGRDPWTRRAESRLRELFGADSVPLLTWNGTGANVLAVHSLLRPGDAVFVAESAHLTRDESGAPERVSGAKLVSLPTVDGKMSPDAVRPELRALDDFHMAEPRIVSITQATELGTVYAPTEVAALADLAHEHGLYLHMDGARLANAAAALGLGLAEVSTACGVDVLSFGGTKNGLLGADAVIWTGAVPVPRAERLRKNVTQLPSKLRFVAAQFVALLTDDLWLSNAVHANRVAALLAERLDAFESECRITAPVQTNMVFTEMPAEWARVLVAEYGLESVPRSRDVAAVRFVASWDSTDADVDAVCMSLSVLQRSG